MRKTVSKTKHRPEKKLNSKFLLPCNQHLMTIFGANFTNDNGVFVLRKKIVNLLESIIKELRKSKARIIGSVQIRRAVLNIFPKTLQQFAFARIAQVMMIKGLRARVTFASKNEVIVGKTKKIRASPRNIAKKRLKGHRKRLTREKVSKAKTKMKSKEKKRASANKDAPRTKLKPAIKRKTKLIPETPKKKRRKISQKLAKKPTKTALKESKKKLKPGTKQGLKRKLPVASQEEKLKKKPLKRDQRKPKDKKVKTASKLMERKNPEMEPKCKLELKQRIKQLVVRFGATFDNKNTISFLESQLLSLLEYLVEDMKEQETKTVTSINIRQTVINIFPDTLQELALARINKVLIISTSTVSKNDANEPCCATQV